MTDPYIFPITGNTAYPYYNYNYNKANGGGVYCRGRLELSGSPVIEGNKLTTGESNNLVSYSYKTKITDTLNGDAKIYVYMKDTSTQDQTLATVDSSVSSVDAKNIFYCDNANFVADFDAANKKIKWRVNSLAYANIDKNGILTTIKKGEVYVRAESEENKEIKDRYKIIITKDISPYILQKPIIELSRTDLAINTIRIHKCKGANEYYLYVQKKKDNGKKYWKKIYEYYGSNFETKEIRIVNSEMGKNYKYRLEVRNVNYVKKDKKEYSVIKTEYSDILSVVTGKPKVRVNKNNEICWLKMSHWNYKKGGYEIYRKNGSTYKKIKTINDYNTNKYYDEKAKKNIKYSYKIRAFYYMGKNKKFSPYSSDITIKK